MLNRLTLALAPMSIWRRHFTFSAYVARVHRVGQIRTLPTRRFNRCISLARPASNHVGGWIGFSPKRRITCTSCPATAAAER